MVHKKPLSGENLRGLERTERERVAEKSRKGKDANKMGILKGRCLLNAGRGPLIGAWSSSPEIGGFTVRFPEWLVDGGKARGEPTPTFNYGIYTVFK